MVEERGDVGRWESGEDLGWSGLIVATPTTIEYQATLQKFRKIHVPSVNESASRSPVELERSRAVGNRRAIEAKGLVCGVRSAKLNEAVARIAVREAIRHQFLALGEVNMVQRLPTRSSCHE